MRPGYFEPLPANIHHGHVHIPAPYVLCACPNMARAGSYEHVPPCLGMVHAGSARAAKAQYAVCLLSRIDLPVLVQ